MAKLRHFKARIKKLQNMRYCKALYYIFQRGQIKHNYMCVSKEPSDSDICIWVSKLEARHPNLFLGRRVTQNLGQVFLRQEHENDLVLL